MQGTCICRDFERAAFVAAGFSPASFESHESSKAVVRADRDLKYTALIRLTREGAVVASCEI